MPTPEWYEANEDDSDQFPPEPEPIVSPDEWEQVLHNMFLNEG